ncbi:exported hypothetical protein [Alteromonas infernus]
MSKTMRVYLATVLLGASAYASGVGAKGNAHHWQSTPHHLSALVGTTYTKVHKRVRQRVYAGYRLRIQA